jgi:hypothetical protein
MKQRFDSPWIVLPVGIVLTAVLYALAQRLVPHTVG